MAHHRNERGERNPLRTGAIALAVAAALGVTGVASAVTVTWDGSGNPNTGGAWETDTNWDTDGLPGTGDNATLGDVTAGTRAVTLNAPQTINRLTLTQTTVGAVNTLTLNDDLTLNGGNGYVPFNYTPTAGVGSIVTNFSAGTTLTAATTGNIVTANFGGTLNMATGSTLLIRTTSNTGSYSFNNSGIATMNGADLEFDYAAAANGNGDRFFTNSGTWTLSNGSSVAFTTSNGRATAGFGIGRYNRNSGTISVASGSSVGFDSLYNVGTMNLGSSTAGVSDATVNLGSPDSTFVVSRLVNGLTQDGATNTAGAGTMNFHGDVVLGVSSGNAATTTYSQLVNGGSFGGTGGGAAITDYSTGSTINVGDGVTPMTLGLSNYNGLVHNAAGNSFNVNANATLALRALGTTNGAGARIQNNGTFTHAGAIELFKTGGGQNKVITSSTGVYAINGVDATLEFQVFSANNELAVNGRLTGSGVNDVLTFLTNSAPVNLNDADVTPGNGNGAVGTLALVNTNVTFGGASTLFIDLIGDEVDLLSIDGDLDLSSSGDMLSLSASGVQSLERYVFATYTGTLAGTFDFDAGLGAGWTLDYSVPNEIAVVVPEPGSLALLSLGALGLLRRRRSMF